VSRIAQLSRKGTRRRLSAWVIPRTPRGLCGAGSRPTAIELDLNRQNPVARLLAKNFAYGLGEKRSRALLITLRI